MKIINVLLIAVLTLGLITIGGCTSESQLKEKIAKIMKENPSILTDAIEQNPADFVESFQKAITDARGEMAKRRAEEEKKKMEETFDKPLSPEISEKMAVRGPKDAPITLVEYSDFQCPFCARGYKTVKDLEKKYEGKIRFIYKHLPLSFHPHAMLAAQYFEAINLQDSRKAFEFHDALYDNQNDIKEGEAYLKKVAKKVGADMSKLLKDLHSEVVKVRIERDQEEANKFEMSGTPGFIINGVPVKGAYPIEHFEQIVDSLKEKGKITL